MNVLLKCSWRKFPLDDKCRKRVSTQNSANDNSFISIIFETSIVSQPLANYAKKVRNLLYENIIRVYYLF